MPLLNKLLNIPTLAEEKSTRALMEGMLPAIASEIRAAEMRIQEGKPRPTDQETIDVLGPQLSEMASDLGLAGFDQRSLVTGFARAPKGAVAPSGAVVGTFGPEGQFRPQLQVPTKAAPPTADQRLLNEIDRLEGIPNRSAAEQRRLDRNIQLLEKRTTITGRTPEDIKVSDPVRLRNIKNTITGNTAVLTELVNLTEQIRELPTAVGGIGAAREVAGGLVGQLADWMNSEWLERISVALSPEELTTIRTTARSTLGKLIPIILQDRSGRYSRDDMHRVQEAQRALAASADSRQSIHAISTIVEMVLFTDRLLRQELQEGFGQTFLNQSDIGVPAFTKGLWYQDDATGRWGRYLGVNPADSGDPRNWEYAD